MLYFQAAESLFRSSNSIWAQRGLPMNWEPFAFQLAYLYSSSTTSEHNYSAIPRISLRKSLEFLAGSVLMATNDWPSFASLFWVSASWICLNFTNILNSFISGKWKWNSEICACLHLSVVYIFRKLANYRSRVFANCSWLVKINRQQKYLNVDWSFCCIGSENWACSYCCWDIKRYWFDMKSPNISQNHQYQATSLTNLYLLSSCHVLIVTSSQFSQNAG